MSRVHKYRAWDKKEKRMLEVCGLFWDINGTNVVELDTIDPSTPYYELEHRIEDVELMEFTGLLDKNEVEIYEGDIGKLTTYQAIVGKKEQIVTVKWNGDRFSFVDLKGKELWCVDIRSFWLNFEVLGNRFENPEYLEE